MDDMDNELTRKAYHEAGCALALYRICFNLSKGKRSGSPAEDVSSMLELCRSFTGCSLSGERTRYWNDVAYFWRASELIFLGGYAAVRIKLQMTGMPSRSDPEFETAYLAQQWFYVDLDRNPDDEQVLRETLEGLNRAMEQMKGHWQTVEILAATLNERSQLSAEETFHIISANIDGRMLDNERNARQHSSPTGQISTAVPIPAAPKPRVEVGYETIQGSDLQPAPFLRCCDGNADLFPFKCFICGHIMVFCYECDTLYPELQDTSIMQLHVDHLDCPRCHYKFQEGFMKYPGYYVTPAEWKQAGYEMLLTDSGRKKLPTG